MPEAKAGGFGERLLLALSRNPDSPDYSITTSRYTLANALDFVKKTIPNFAATVKDKTVLDFGCGPGWQAVAMFKECGAKRVVGVDIKEAWLNAANALASAEGCNGVVTFGRETPADLRGKFDIAFSIGSFEHFNDPGAILAQMRDQVRPGGSIVITFAEPWYSRTGAHMSFFTKVPWVNILFSEKTVLSVRARFRNDGATRYEDVESGLNRMTLAKFERIIAASGMKVNYIKLHTTKGLPLVDKLPLVRELLVSAVTCSLRRD